MGEYAPEGANEEWIDARNKAKKEAMDEMRRTGTQEHRVTNMIGKLEQEFPELPWTVRCYTERQHKRRKRETLDADAENGGRPRKRIGTKAPDDMISAVAARHARYTSVVTDYKRPNDLPRSSELTTHQTLLRPPNARKQGTKGRRSVKVCSRHANTTSKPA